MAIVSDEMSGQPLAWKIRKVARYLRIYGLRSTSAKVRSQYHMDSRLAEQHDSNYDNAQCSDSNSPSRTVAIVGCGKFAYSVIASHLSREHPAFLRATLDVNLNRAASLCAAYGGLYATTQLERLLSDPKIDLVYIASNHASHADYAVKFIDAGKAVHIEKPHAVRRDQLAKLEEQMNRSPAVPVFLGFNRPRSRHFEAISSALAREAGPIAVNWFIAGHQIADDHWYFSPEEGGRVLGNLCHWLDFSLRLVGADSMFPCTLIPSSQPGASSDFALTLHCQDGSLVTIAFSAKGHAFEGVREVLNVHRGSTLALLRDFEETRINRGHQRTALYRSRHRDHGHKANVLNSFHQSKVGRGSNASYVHNSGMLALSAKEALDTGLPVTMTGKVSARRPRSTDDRGRAS